MIIGMESDADFRRLSFGQYWDIAIVGSALDDRGHAAIAAAKGCSRDVTALTYDPIALSCAVDSHLVDPDEIPEWFSQLKVSHVLLECTTLGLVELSLCCRGAKEAGLKRLSFLYTEPGGYSRSTRRQVLHRRDFRLTDMFQEVSGVPGAAYLVQGSSRAMFLLGYEGERLEQVIEQTGLRPSHCSVLFGVPAFRPGWEMDSFSNNIRILRDRNIGGGVMFCGAQNPRAAFDEIDAIFKTCGDDERLFLAPIGTKPHGIAAALFAAVHDVGLLYDHPTRKPGRSSDIATWHLYESEGWDA